eukprot:1125007-Pleurochrysis_carterae.AAC.1
MRRRGASASSSRAGRRQATGRIAGAHRRRCARVWFVERPRRRRGGRQPRSLAFCGRRAALRPA